MGRATSMRAPTRKVIVLMTLLVCSYASSAYARSLEAPPSATAKPDAAAAKPDAAAKPNAAAGSKDGDALSQLLSGLNKLATKAPAAAAAPGGKQQLPSAGGVPSPSPAIPSATFMEQFVKNGTCNQTMLPNGNFEADKKDAYRITNWIKIKEKGANGGGIIANGSDPAATGWPGYPFNGANKFFKTQAFGNVGFALTNQYAIEVNSTRQILYFDWFMDNGFEYWLVPNTMSIHANASNVTLHAARVDLYDFDKLDPPGNLTQLAQYLFDPFNATSGPAYLGPALTVPDIVSFGNLQSVGSFVPLAPYMGKRVLVVFRYSTTVYLMTWGIDNVSVVTCDDSTGFYANNRKHRRLH